MEDTTINENPFTLPSLAATWKLPYNPHHGADGHQFFDVKFWPYFNDGDSGPIFAVVGCRDILICGTRVDEDGLADVHHVLRDEEALGSERLPILNTCSWAYIHESNALLAVSGPSGQIKLLEACSGSLFTTLTGHGAGLINDLATHPLYPWILASASIDSSIRIWDLRRWEDQYESPCIVICGQGQGHQDGMLSIAWHLSGRYIVSGAHDNAVCVWTIPDLSDASEFWVSISPTTRKSKSDAVHVVQYPHFATAAVHSNYVDCVCFFGDMILSKAASEDEKNKIVLWEITGFDSKLPPPSSDSAPKTQEHKDTRSGFYLRREGSKSHRLSNDGGRWISQKAEAEDAPLYVQHLEFDLPEAQYFYLRFGLLMPSRAHPNLHPVLVCGNTEAQIFMWDLHRLELGHTEGYQTLPTSGRPKHETYLGPAKKSNKKQARNLEEQRLSTPIRRTPGSQTSSTPNAIGESPASHPQTVPNREQYPISDPFTPITPHKTITLPEDMLLKKEFRTTFRGVSWSPCGRWCVVVGDCQGTKKRSNARGALLSRWL